MLALSGQDLTACVLREGGFSSQETSVKGVSGTRTDGLWGREGGLSGKEGLLLYCWYAAL